MTRADSGTYPSGGVRDSRRTTSHERVATSPPAHEIAWSAPADTGLHAATFGGITLRVDGREVPLRGTQRRRLMALLLAERGRPVSAARIIDALRDGQSPSASDPVNAAHAHVNRLRRLLDPGRSGRGERWVRRLPDGYLLVPETFDQAQYEELVRRATSLSQTDPARAMDYADEALAMWAEPWGDLGDDALIAESADRLRRRHLTLEETWSSLAVDQGLGGRYADRLVAYAQTEPTREVRWATAMRALSQAGRQGDALALYARARRVLVEELGVEPGPDLRLVHTAVLRHDYGVLGPARRSYVALVPRPLDSFVGRQDELSALDDAAREARLVTLVGLGGCGKSRLTQEWVHGTARSGATYWIDLRGCDESAVTLRMVAELGLVAGDTQPTQHLRLIAGALPSMPITLVLDNVDTAASGVADVLARLLALAPHVRVVVTSRLPIGLAGERILTLRPLPMPEPGGSIEGTAVDLVRTHLGRDADDTAVLNIAARSGGLPLAVEVIAAAARLSPDGSADTVLGQPGDDPVAEAVDQAVRHLSPQARALFARVLHLPGGCGTDLAGMLMVPDAPPLTGRHTDTDQNATRARLLRELVGASLLVTSTAPRGVRHRTLTPIADNWARWSTPNEGADAWRAFGDWIDGRLRHSFFDPPDTPSIMAVSDERLNVDAFLTHLRNHEPARLLRVAVLLQDVWAYSGRAVEGHSWIRHGLELTDAEGVERLAANVALLNSRGLGHAASSTELMSESAALADVLSDAPVDLRAAALVQRAVSSGWRGEVAGMIADLAEARRLAAAAQSDWFLAVVDEFEGLSGLLTGRAREGIAQCLGASRSFQQLDDGDSAVVAAYFATVIARLAGLPEHASLVDQAVALAADHGSARTKAHVASERARLLLEQGRPEGIDSLREALEHVERGGNPHNAALSRRDLGLLLHRAGEWAAAQVELLTAVLRLLPDDPSGAAVGLAPLMAEGPGGREVVWSLATSGVGTPLSPRDREILAACVGPLPQGRAIPLGEAIARVTAFLTDLDETLAHSSLALGTDPTDGRGVRPA